MLMHEEDVIYLRTLLEQAWVIISNAGNGDWGTEPPLWQAAAERWRDRYFEAIKTFDEGD